MNAEKCQHPPGHPIAVTYGCTCPVLDNHYGRGCGYLDKDGNPLFIFSFDCPLHKDAPEMAKDELCYFDKAAP